MAVSREHTAVGQRGREVPISELRLTLPDIWKAYIPIATLLYQLHLRAAAEGPSELECSGTTQPLR